MIGRSLPVPVVPPDDTERPVAIVVSLFATTHRWWKLAVDLRGKRPAPAALVGIASTVVWRGSVAAVPCPEPENGNAGPCACSLHAPAAAVDRARSLASIVVGGYVRVLSVGHDDPNRPHAVLAVEGPLSLQAWCGGAQDGFTLERCERDPAWAVHTARSSGAFCRRHLRSIPRGVRENRQRLDDFEVAAVVGLGRRYGVEVRTGLRPSATDSPAPEPVAAPQAASAWKRWMHMVEDRPS